MELDEALTAIGEWGRYQTIEYFLITIPGTWFCVWPLMAMVFLGGFPDTFYCNVPEGSSLNETIPLVEDDDGELVYDSCTMYVNSSVDNSTTECTDGWYYESEYFVETIVTEWDLVCDDAIVSQFSQSIFMAGVMIGAFLAGYLSDRFGRKKVYLISMWSASVIGITVAFTQTMIGFTILRFFQGICVQGIMVSNFILATEMFPPRSRVYAGYGNTICWACGIVVLAPIAYIFRHWRALQLAMSIPGLLTFYYIWVVPESMRWLISMERIPKAEAILYKAAKFNKKSLPENVLSNSILDAKETRGDGKCSNIYINSTYVEGPREERLHRESFKRVLTETTQLGAVTQEKTLESDDRLRNSGPEDTDALGIQEEDPHYTMIDLCKRPRLAISTSIMCFSWFVTSMVYLGISYNTANVGTNVYAAFFWSGVVEIPGYLIAMFATIKWGHRIPSCLLLILAGLACGMTPFIPDETSDGTDIQWLQTVFFLLGKLAITGAYGVIWTWAPEIFPTLVRNLGFGLTNFFASLGGVVAPLTVYIGYNNLSIVMASFGVLSLIASVVVLFLPETKDRPVPRTLDEAEQNYRKTKKTKNVDAEVLGAVNHAYTSQDEILTKKEHENTGIQAHDIIKSYQKSNINNLTFDKETQTI
uniref:Organic cation transporter protein-like n=1 Tax=Saccoglossus kowalevskii TaxID=10224 RepID=A0ABM0M6Y5_SACKO|nr:PREDICTED: organic cation transporter protein-like [Saccoglossus kowalevskii]